MLTPFAKKWVPRRPRGTPPLFPMSEGHLKLTRALELAILHQDITQTEAALLLTHVEWAMLMEGPDSIVGVARQVPRRRDWAAPTPVAPKRRRKGETAA